MGRLGRAMPANAADSTMDARRAAASWASPNDPRVRGDVAALGVVRAQRDQKTKLSCVWLTVLVSIWLSIPAIAAPPAAVGERFEFTSSARGRPSRFGAISVCLPACGAVPH